MNFRNSDYGDDPWKELFRAYFGTLRFPGPRTLMRISWPREKTVSRRSRGKWFIALIDANWRHPNAKRKARK
jgi:hypothetical protein